MRYSVCCVTEKYELPLAVATAVGLAWLRSACASRQFGALNVARVLAPSLPFSGAPNGWPRTGPDRTTKVTRSSDAKLPCGRHPHHPPPPPAEIVA
jgi:hypothetical protein